jgi:hypothetical protein
MRTRIWAVFLVAVALFTSKAVANGKPANEFIQISVKAEKDSLKTGGEGRLLFTITPKAGFHVNLEPPISLALAEEKNFTLLTKKFIPDSSIKQITTKDGYKIFNPAAPVAFGFKVAKSLKPGRHTLQAKLTYYYCSDAEGWCSFTTETFPVTITIILSK